MNLTSRLIDLAMQIQQIPAPTFSEGARAEFVRNLFEKEKLKDVSMDSLGNVYARLPGKQKKAKALVVSAHLDTVFPPSVSLQIRKEADRIYAPGIGDNSIGVAALFGIIQSFHERGVKLGHDVWFVANVGEEGLGDLRGMRGVVERFGGEVIGYLVLEGLALGHVYHRAIGVKRYRITAKTAGGHSWSDYGQPSAVHELASLVTQLTSIRLPREPRTTMNVGTIHGGLNINSVPDRAVIGIDIRTIPAQSHAQIREQLTSYLGRDVTLKTLLDAKSIWTDPHHPWIGEVFQVARDVEGVDDGLGAAPYFTDASALTPALGSPPTVIIGPGELALAHQTDEYCLVSRIERATEIYSQLIRGWCGI